MSIEKRLSCAEKGVVAIFLFLFFILFFIANELDYNYITCIQIYNPLKLLQIRLRKVSEDLAHDAPLKSNTGLAVANRGRLLPRLS